MTPETAVPIKETPPRTLKRSSNAIPGHPRIEMFDFGDRLIIKTELSGVERDDIDLRLEGRDLVIYGVRHDEDEVKGDDRSRMEPALGSILHRIPMPFCVAPGDVQASFNDSVLRVEVRKRAGTQPKGDKINVR
jgi:HSP20 family protein